ASMERRGGSSSPRLARAAGAVHQYAESHSDQTRPDVEPELEAPPSDPTFASDQRFYTLNRNSTTSPSTVPHCLRSRRPLPAARPSAMEPSASRSPQRTISA